MDPKTQSPWDIVNLELQEYISKAHCEEKEESRMILNAFRERLVQLRARHEKCQ